jgi:DNA-binding MarR family transcriptional regulator
MTIHHTLPGRCRGASAALSGGVQPGDRLDSVLTFMRLLWEVDHGMRSASRRMRILIGVTGPERLILRMLGGFPGVSAGELARLLHVHPSTLTGALERLVLRRLIGRKAHSQDRRRVELALTPSGRRLDRLRSGTVEARFRRALSGLPARKVTAARQVLAALARELGPLERR